MNSPSKIYKTHLQTPLGFLEIIGTETSLVSVTFFETKGEDTETIPEVLKEAKQQLKEYFEGKRTLFNLKVEPQGTDFQKKVWEHLQEIPFGVTSSYQQMAHKLGDPKVIRAAASANGKNPIAIIIPCHRVIGSDGSLTGYAGGLQRKKWLLEHESPVKQGILF
ncbi:MAG: methylated-DNA--[protein]-cysteine S-methyltransferase [Flavobacteriaceae bacterium]